MNLLSRIHYLLGTDNRKPERGLAWLVGLMVVAIPLVLIGLDGHFAGRNAVAQDREDGRSVEAKGRPQAAEREAKQRSPEAVAERRRSPEAEAKRRRSPEAEVGPSRSAEGDRGPSRSAEGAGRRDRTNPLQRFKPQTEREAALYQMILQLQREVDQLRQAIGQPSADKSGEGRESVGQRDGKIPPLTAGWERTKAGNVFRAYDKNGDAFVALDEWLAMTNGNINAARRELQTQRFRATRPGSDDKLSPAEFIYWWNHREGAQRGRRDGDRAKRGPRDAEGRRSVEAEAGPRRSPEEEAGPRRSPEEEAGPRGSAESDSGANRDSGDGA